MTFEDEMRAALQTFVVEGRELLQDMETALLGLEVDAGSDEIVNEVFRAAHTIKGSAGLFGLEHIVRFTHVLESVLDRVRTHEIAVSSELVGLLLPCRDHLADLMEGVPDGVPETATQAAAGARLQVGLEGYLTDAPVPQAQAPDEAAPDDEAPDDEAPDETAADDGVTGRTLHLSLRFGPESLRNGMDPLAFISYLGTLGDVVDLETIADQLPEATALDPECCYLGFELTLRTEASVEAVTGVFEFVLEDSQIVVLGPEATIGDFADLVVSFGPHGARIAQNLVRTGAVEGSQLTAALGQATWPAPTTSADPVPPVATADVAVALPAPVAAGTVPAPRDPQPEPAPPARVGAPAQPDARRRDSQSIRVDAPRLDRLIDVVGELVIAGAGAGLQASQNGDAALVAAIGEVMRLVEEVRDGALQLRMVPIGTTFSRFQRVVRDVSADLGKDVDLVITGGDTEVDKALVEKIGDPLMHLVRNALDHGIESADERAARGKPVRGTLRLNAFHDSGSIVIEVADDGGGIDREAVLAKAVQRGLVEPGAVLSDAAVYDLLFEPGFSTAAQVSDLSGRGVGMDVVKRNVTALRGTIDVVSELGVGSTMRIRLPLTLAIIDGFLVGVSSATYVVPLDRVVECVELPTGTGTRDCMDLRGEVLPFIRLRSWFEVSGERPRRESVVVVEYAGVKTGLVVDILMGEFQTVIKPLGQLFAHVQGIGGSTILGNGDIALILDVPMLVHHYADQAAGVGRSAAS